MENEIISKIRAFNRYYVRVIGLLENTFLNSGYSLTDAHILSVIKSQKDSTATSINKELNLDEGYLSRLIKKLTSKSLITKKQSLADKRIFVINLTEKGLIEYNKMDKLSSELVKTNIEHLDLNQRLELANLMEKVKLILKKNDTL